MKIPVARMLVLHVPVGIIRRTRIFRFREFRSFLRYYRWQQHEKFHSNRLNNIKTHQRRTQKQRFLFMSYQNIILGSLQHELLCQSIDLSKILATASRHVLIGRIWRYLPSVDISVHPPAQLLAADRLEDLHRWCHLPRLLRTFMLLI